MIILPIRTESVVRRTPLVNYILISANVLMFMVFDERLAGKALLSFKDAYLVFPSYDPTLYQFFTYQFLHADVLHVVGNMLFLWVFGNSVNAKMGNGPFLLFYLAGGVFAAWGYALIHVDYSHLIGASGAVAAVTTAYLALFPRSHVTVLIWFFLFIHFIEVPAMLLIGLKIIVWDNLIGPALMPTQRIAHSAHLAGYFFGFVGSLLMLAVGGITRDQFDILAVWRRWHQRRGFAAAMADPRVAARAQFGSAARTDIPGSAERAKEEELLDRVAALRSRIAEQLDEGQVSAAAELYQALLALSPGQCLSERQQLAVARTLYNEGRYAEAATAFDRFVSCYADSLEAANVRLLLGIIYARDLQQYDAADRHLTESMEELRDENRRGQCRQWLTNVRAALGRAAPDSGG